MAEDVPEGRVLSSPANDDISRWRPLGAPPLYATREGAMHQRDRRSSRIGRRFVLFLTLAFIAALEFTSGCAALKETVALRQVDFQYDRITDPAIAGLPLSKFSRYESLSMIDVGRLALAVAAKDVPLDITVHVVGRNPAENNTTARLVRLDWSYLVDDREILAGNLAQEFTFPPGQPRDLPLGVRFNLIQFFGNDGKVLFDTALVLSGQRTSTKKVTLRLTPTIESPLGPIHYPVPITLDLGAAN
jgi:hypothetical protein